MEGKEKPKEKVVVKQRKRKQNARSEEEVQEDEVSVSDSPVQISKKSKTSAFTSTTKKSQENSLDVKINADRTYKLSDQGATLTDTIDGDYEDKLRAKEKKEKEKNPYKKFGPTRGNNSMRATIAIDYKPDICKDYFDTGFCGYGEGCKFAHIREDYKSGWELDKEFEDSQKQKEDVKEEKELPFACHLCRNTFVDPVVTKCNHFFCEKCALKHYDGGKNTKCAVCSEQTFGVFNTAYEMIRKMKREEERKAKPKAEWEIEEKERKYQTWAIK
jgi:RING finger protein 113A